jgi:hypothetical protein
LMTNIKNIHKKISTASNILLVFNHFTDTTKFCLKKWTGCCKNQRVADL